MCICWMNWGYMSSSLILENPFSCLSHWLEKREFFDVGWPAQSYSILKILYFLVSKKLVV